jgi:hypothetical protein
MMNDPHVESLHYQFVSESPSDIYDKAEPLETPVGPFDVELRDGLLTALPHEHFLDADSAKSAFEPFLRSWESSAVLRPGRYRFRFTYRTAEVIDRNPPPSDEIPGRVIRAQAVDYILVGEDVSFSRGIPAYPAPNPSFRASELMDRSLLRFKRVRDGRQALPPMAYWFLDHLAEAYGGRESIPNALAVSRNVLGRLANLTSEVADPVLGRKAGDEKREYTAAELQWLEAVVTRLIVRVGEVNAAEGPLDKITLADFPSI